MRYNLVVSYTYGSKIYDHAKYIILVYNENYNLIEMRHRNFNLRI